MFSEKMFSSQIEGSCRFQLKEIETQIRLDPSNFMRDLTRGPRYDKYNSAMMTFDKQKDTIERDIEKWKESIKVTPSSDPTSAIRKNRFDFLAKIGGRLSGIGLTFVMGAQALLHSRMITVSTAIVPTSVGCIALARGLIYLLERTVMKNNQVARETRVQKSENFKDFVRNVVKMERELSNQELQSAQLHKIYRHYKAAVNSLPLPDKR